MQIDSIHCQVNRLAHKKYHNYEFRHADIPVLHTG